MFSYGNLRIFRQKARKKGLMGDCENLYQVSTKESFNRNQNAVVKHKIQAFQEIVKVYVEHQVMRNFIQSTNTVSLIII